MVQIPAGYVAADGSDTRLLMEGMGNPPSHDEVGLIAPDGLDWFVVFEFSNTGYVKDDEKSSLDADAILASLVKANNQANEARKKMGFGPLTILGWEQQPHYDILTNNLTWAIRGREDGGSLVINHNTRLLGRSGVMRVTLVGSPDVLPRIMRDYRARLGTFTFNAGHRYSEFRQGDKIAKYGLSALIVGGATAVAVKSGAAKGLWKLLVLVGVGAAAGLGRLFRRRS